MSWIGVCDSEQVQEDFPFSGNVEGKEIGVYLIDGEYYALEDVCPHAYALLLSQGFVEDGKVWNARCTRRCSTSKPASACKAREAETSTATRFGYLKTKSRLLLSRRPWHRRDILNSTRRCSKAASLRPGRGRNGAIHKPGEYQNLILADPQPGAGKLGNEPYRHAGKISLSRALKPCQSWSTGLNAVRMYDQQGEPWSDASFRRHSYRLTATEDDAMTTTVQNYLR